MKIISLAILLICIQAGIGIADYLGIFLTSAAWDKEYIEGTVTEAKSVYTQAEVGETEWWQQAKELGKSLVMFGLSIGKAIILFPWMLNSIWGVPLTLAVLVSMPIGIIQVIGLIQLFRNANTPQMR